MNMFALSLSNLKFRRLSSFFNVLVLALGIATMVTLLHISQQIGDRFERDLRGIDLVVGAKGSPIQLILSSVFHLDIPNGNIPLSEADRLKASPLVKSAIPIALGDSYKGFHIVGTTPEYGRHYAAEFAQGDYWTKNLQAVLGSEVARVSRLKIGEKFAGTHGLMGEGEEHTDYPYQVVGILKRTGTVLDRLVLTDVGSVWDIHEHDPDEPPHQGGHEITSLLITYSTPAAAVTLPRLVNKTSSMEAASPAFETARLLKLLGIGSDTIELFAGVLMAIAALGFFVTLWSAVNDRRYDIALMRSLGATRRKLFAFVLTEGVLLGVFGIILGLALGHAFAYGVKLWIEESRHMALNPVGFHPLEGWIALIALAISVLAAIIPACMAYRVNVASVLSRGL